MRRSFRHIAVLLTVLLLANTPVQAGPVTIGDVVQIVGSYQNPPSLGLPGSSQGRTSSRPGGSTQTIDSSVVIINHDSLLSGVVESETTQDPVNIVVQGDVEGSVCDCGEVTVPGGLPKWPLAFLAAIPFFFIEDDDCDNCDKIVPTPTPTPNATPTATPTPPAPIPEPASLLLFGSGLAALGAGLRRRRLKAKLKIEGESTEEG
jgi:hypothetical protein